MMYTINRELSVSVWDLFFFWSRHGVRKARNTGKYLQGNASQSVKGLLQFISDRFVLNKELLGKQEGIS